MTQVIVSPGGDSGEWFLFSGFSRGTENCLGEDRSRKSPGGSFSGLWIFRGKCRVPSSISLSVHTDRQHCLAGEFLFFQGVKVRDGAEPLFHLALQIGGRAERWGDIKRTHLIQKRLLVAFAVRHRRRPHGHPQRVFLRVKKFRVRRGKPRSQGFSVLAPENADIDIGGFDLGQVRFLGSASRPPNSSNITGRRPAARTPAATAFRSSGNSDITLEMKARFSRAHSFIASGEGSSAAAARSIINGSACALFDRLGMNSFYGFAWSTDIQAPEQGSLAVFD